MNIEGAELELIKGAKETIEKFNPSFAISTDHTVDGELTYIKAENFFNELSNYHSETIFYNDGNIITYATPEYIKIYLIRQFGNFTFYRYFILLPYFSFYLYYIFIGYSASINEHKNYFKFY